MSIKKTKHTKHWKSIPKKCKSCSKAIYIQEGKEIMYQCSIYGNFKRDCGLEIVERYLPKPEELLENNNDSNS